METKKDSYSFIWGKRTALETIYPQRKKKKRSPKRYRGQEVESTILENDVPHTEHNSSHRPQKFLREIRVEEHAGNFSQAVRKQYEKDPLRGDCQPSAKIMGNWHLFCAYCITDGASADMGFVVMETCTHSCVTQWHRGCTHWAAGLVSRCRGTEITHVQRSQQHSPQHKNGSSIRNVYHQVFNAVQQWAGTRLISMSQCQKHGWKKQTAQRYIKYDLKIKASKPGLT